MQVEIDVLNGQSRYHREVLSVKLDGEPLKLLSDKTSRSVWTNGKVVVKVDRGVPQAQREAETWMRLEPEDRQWFATLLEVGPDYVVEEFVPLERLPYDSDDFDKIMLQAQDLFEKYEMMHDWQGWEQFGIDKRTGFLCIHDYMSYDYIDEGTYRWTTI